MATISIRNFSCIEKADLRLGHITILIGPQASGKSLISKLVFFLYDILDRQYRSLEQEIPFEAFRSGLSQEFEKWFPYSAWGKKKFTIKFRAGVYTVRVTHSPSSRKRLRWTFSPFFKRQYLSFLAEIQKRKRRRKRKLVSGEPLGQFEWFAVLERASQRRIERALRQEFVGYQLFIPAGRSFFTSLGKALAAFEFGSLEPLMLRFGQYFARLVDRPYLRFDRLPLPRGPLSEVFGGQLRFTSDGNFVETKDGRRIPFPNLSSGQQELLPLLLALEVFGRRHQSMTYIEEPEAHLFPSSQSRLMEYLARLSANEFGFRRLLITTHSPYILTKANVLMKVSSLAKSSGNLRRLEKAVGKTNVVRLGEVEAYSLKGGICSSIISDDGLIDAEYLDEISNELTREFSSLLDIEYADDAR